MKILKIIAEHLFPSLIIGLIGWLFTKNVILFVVPLATGWLIDTDHLLDLLIARQKDRKSDSLLECLTGGSYFMHNDKIIILLHSWELAFLWAAIWWLIEKPGIAVIGSLAWVVHLTIDQNLNKVGPWAYFLSYRLAHKFNFAFLLKNPKA